MRDNDWDAYIEDVRRYVTSGKLDLEEIGYKLKLGEELAAARDAMLSGGQDWIDLVRIALCGNQNNLVDWRLRDSLGTWINAHADRASAALKEIWVDDESGPGERIRRFMSELPQDVLRGKGTRLNPVSVLLMGLAQEFYPHHTDQGVSVLSIELGMAAQAHLPEALMYEHALDPDVLIKKAAEERPRQSKSCKSDR